MGVSDSLCYYCNRDLAIEENEFGKLICKECKIKLVSLVESKASEKAARSPAIVARGLDKNCLCPCGSGKKYRRCCIKKKRVMVPNVPIQFQAPPIEEVNSSSIRIDPQIVNMIQENRVQEAVREAAENYGS